MMEQTHFNKIELDNKEIHIALIKHVKGNIPFPMVENLKVEIFSMATGGHKCFITWDSMKEAA